MDLRERIGIETPEHVEFSYEIAGLGSRFTAGLIDVCIQGGALIALLLAFWAGSGVTSFPAFLESALDALMLLALFLVIWGYHLYFEAFRGGRSAEDARKDWKAYGQGLRLRAEGKDPGAGVEVLAALRDGAKHGSAVRESVEEALRRIEENEARGLIELAKADLGGEDAATAIETLFQVMREFPGLPSAAKAAELVAAAKGEPAKADAIAKEQKELDAWLALRAGDRHSREGRAKEAREAWGKVLSGFAGTRAAAEAAERK